VRETGFGTNEKNLAVVSCLLQSPFRAGIDILETMADDGLWKTDSGAAFALPMKSL